MSHAVVLVAVECEKIEMLEDLIAEQMEPFDENGEWFKDGSRWDYWKIGGRWDGYLHGANFRRKGEFSLNKWVEMKRERREYTWEQAEIERKERNSSDEIISVWYGIEKGQSREEYLALTPQFFSCPVFLRNRVWNEYSRMGWFGETAKTECEVFTEGYKGKCVKRLGESGAKIISWDEDPRWEEKFWGRFIKPLSDETYLVVVDFHV